MSFPGLDLVLSHAAKISFLFAGIVVAGLVAVKAIWTSDLNAIPTVGPKSLLESWWVGFKFAESGHDVLQEGYAKYKGRPFKIAKRYHWLVIVSSREHLEELRNATDDQFSFGKSIRERTSGDYTIGKAFFENPYHTRVICSRLSHNIETLFSEIMDEIVTGFDQILDLQHDEWKSMAALITVQKIAFRTSNRIFVGLPLCRDPGWMNLNIQNLINIISGSYFLQLFPPFMHSFLSLWIPSPNETTERGVKFLTPIIRERQRCLEVYGNKWVGKPNDLLSWLMDAAEDKERTDERLTNRVMTINFAFVHSITQIFTHALLYLAVNPQYVKPLHEEVETVINQEGWSNAALCKMRKVDSFLREIQRLKVVIGIEGLQRKATNHHTFSDGTCMPKGTRVAVPVACLHFDEDIYKDATVFDPFRFTEMREANGEGKRHRLVVPTPEYLSFGYGRHACPGRFLATSVMKAMLAHIVLSYDVKLEDNVAVPESIRVVESLVIDPSTKVVFRKRD